MKTIVSILLLLGFTVTVVHPFLMDDYKHETVSSFVEEIDGQTHYGDLCDLHFEFHIPFTLDKPEVIIPVAHYKEPALFGSKHLHTVFISFHPIKPPIA